MIAGLLLAAAVSTAPAERVATSWGEVVCAPAARTCAPVRTTRAGRAIAADTPADLPSWRSHRVETLVIVEPRRRRR